MNSPWVGRGGVKEVENAQQQQGSPPLGQASPEERRLGSDSSFVGESLAEAAEMAANTVRWVVRAGDTTPGK